MSRGVEVCVTGGDGWSADCESAAVGSEPDVAVSGADTPTSANCSFFERVVYDTDEYSVAVVGGALRCVASDSD